MKTKPLTKPANPPAIEIAVMGVQIFPNPVKEVLFIRQQTNRNLLLNIYATDGRIIYSEKILGDLSANILVADFPSSLYLLEIVDLDIGAKAS